MPEQKRTFPEKTNIGSTTARQLLKGKRTYLYEITRANGDLGGWDIFTDNCETRWVNGGIYAVTDYMRAYDSRRYKWVMVYQKDTPEEIDAKRIKALRWFKEYETQSK